jgi:hypothetical protein
MSKIAQMILPEEVSLDEYQANSPSQEARTDTEYLKPQSINQNSCVFRLSNNGILDMENTKVVLAQFGVTDHAYVMSNGIGALVDRAILRWGNVTCCTSDSFGSYMSASRSFVSGDTKRYRDSYLYLTQDYFENRIDTGATTHDGIGFPESTSPTYATLNTNIDAVSDGQIPLSLLFPGMSVLDIPLYVLRNHELTVEIVFKQENGRLGNRAISKVTSPAWSSHTIATDDCFMIVERVYFSSQRMDQIARTFLQNNFTTSYNDMISTKNDLGDFDEADAPKRETFDIGCAGKTCEGVLIATPRTETDTTNDHSKPCTNAFGIYNSDSFLNKGYNLIINGERLLPMDAENMYYSISASLLGSFIDNDYPQIPKALYDTLQKEGTSDFALNGESAQANIKGLCSYQGLKLEDCKVNNVPIRLDLYRKQKTLGGSPTLAQYGLVTHAFVKRIFQITSSGGVQCSFA